jgi:hypothetical protein
MGVGTLAFVWTSQARAQLRWDLGAEAGATDRVAVPGAPARSPGPSIEVHAHVALYPLVRVGPYGSFELSPTDGLEARRIVSGGFRAKVTPPIVPVPWRTWGFIGFGVAYAYTPGSMGLRGDGAAMPELPVGIGVGLKIRSGWEVCAELGARVNVASLGKGSGSEAPPASPAEVFAGDDLLAVSLTVGLNLEP